MLPLYISNVSQLYFYLPNFHLPQKSGVKRLYVA